MKTEKNEHIFCFTFLFHEILYKMIYLQFFERIKRQDNENKSKQDKEVRARENKIFKKKRIYCNSNDNRFTVFFFFIIFFSVFIVIQKQFFACLVVYCLSNFMIIQFFFSLFFLCFVSVSLRTSDD